MHEVVTQNVVTHDMVEDEVRSKEQRFRLLVEHVGDAVFMLDDAGQIETWTPAAERVFGYASADVIGQHRSILHAPADALPPPSTGEPEPARAGDLADLRASSAVPARRLEESRWCRRKAGSLFWAQIITAPLTDSADRVLGFAEIVRDLTATRVAEEALAARAVALERSNRELEEFATIASHDLQEPLRKIRAFGDRLATRSGALLDEGGRSDLERITAAAARMQLLVDDLLAYSRIAARRTATAPVDLRKVVAGAIAELDQTLERTGGRIEVGELPVLAVDEAQMRRLFQNLIANALKFCAEGRPPVVTITSRRLAQTASLLGDVWEIDVADNGIGFEPKHGERIFVMLQRLHARSQYPGTGMGLAICRRIAERHGGEIRAAGRPGEGATFTVRLSTAGARAVKEVGAES